MPIGLNGQQYNSEFEALYSSVANAPEEASETLPVEPRTATQIQGATPVPPSNLNASAGNVEGVRPLLEVGPPLVPDGGQISSGTRIGNAFVQRNEDVLKGIVKSTIEGALAPGNALQGKLPMWAIDPDTGEVNTSTDVIHKTMDLAGMAVLGPAPIAAKMADGTLGSFIGVRAKTFDKNALGEAQILEMGMTNSDDIFKQTGFFRGVDNHWRYEIPDNKSTLKEGWQNLPPSNKHMSEGSQYLEKVLDHPELYKAYPHLRDIIVNYDPRVSGAYYDIGKNEIFVGRKFVDNKSTYLHEIQHAIQEYEGFARGGMVAKNPKLRFEDDLNKLAEEFRTINRKFQSSGPLTEIEKDRVQYLRKVFELNVLRKKAAADEAYNNYRKIAGEVESNNVETRSLSSAEQLRQVPPRFSEDVPRSEQFVSDKILIGTPYGAFFNPNTVP